MLMATDEEDEIWLEMEYNTTCSTKCSSCGWWAIIKPCSQRSRPIPIKSSRICLCSRRRNAGKSSWNGIKPKVLSREGCLHDLVEAQVERTPEAVAVSFGNQRLTYRELNARANQLARHLQKLGVGPDSLVGLCVERSLEMVVGLLGILKAGGAYVRWTRVIRRNGWPLSWKMRGSPSS